jgi:subtilisin family serine protease
VRVFRLMAPLALVAALVVGPAGNSPARAADPARAGRATVVTLVTGDQVVLGARGQVRVRPAAGRERVSFSTSVERGHLVVVPGDALALVGSGVVDQRLFDVTELSEAGYDDARADEVPLIAQYGATVGTPAASRQVRAIPGARVAVLRTPKRTAAEFWRQLAGGASLKGGVTRLWLDGRSRLSLDTSVPRIGAPEVWRTGNTGGGVTVAVLDTGIDASHPDLAGQVVAAQDFTGTTAPGDPVGHGTHVAATVAGTGPTYRGVAPGAKLLDGRVCAALGCQDSAVLAGMQWAAERGARVVNLSLGRADTPGVDAVEEAVGRLSAQYNMLFVVAAGNDGERGRPVSSPSTADAALSVGAVDKADRMAPFSSSGPRPGDRAIKPEVTAPGVDIVAARSSTSVIGDPVGERYLRLSGTSMATPHVAGAASLLMNAHPDWPAARVKAALAGSAVPQAGVSPFAQGAGRIDVARAVATPVTAEPVSIGFGRQLWPHNDDPKLTRTVTYHNSGARELTLALTVDTAAPAGMFTLSATSVTVPAGGDASVTVTANTALPGAADTWHTGRVVARAPAGDGATVTTPVAVEREPESYTVTLRHLGDDGKPTADYRVLVHGYDAAIDESPYDASGTVSIRLLKGKYVFTSWISQSMLVQPWVDVRSDLTVTLDARKAKPVSVRVPRASAAMMMGVIQYYAGEGRIQGGMLADGSFDGLRVGHVGAAAPGHRFAATVTAHFAEPGAAGDFADSPYRYNAAFCRYGRMFDGYTRWLRDADFVAVTQRDLRPDTANLTLLGISSAPAATAPGAILWDYPLAAKPGAARTEHFTTADVRWWQTYQRYRVDGDEQVELTSENLPWRPIRAGETRWGAPVIGPGMPVGYVQPYNARSGDAMRFDLTMFAPGLPNADGWSPVTSARTALYRDGALVAESTEAGDLRATVPGAAADYRLEARAARDVAPHSTRVEAAWTFRSQTAAVVPGGVALPLLAVRFAPRPEQPRELPVWVEWQRPGEATVRQLTVEVSYDDGATWKPTVLVQRDGGWVARLDPPASGFVSVRARATDSRGSGVEQTIIRAYGLNG